MVRLCVSFFTPEIIRTIRNRLHKPPFIDPVIWQVYREYHHQHLEYVSARNAVFIQKEFQNVCEMIVTLSNDTQASAYVARKYGVR